MGISSICMGNPVCRPRLYHVICLEVPLILCMCHRRSLASTPQPPSPLHRKSIRFRDDTTTIALIGLETAFYFIRRRRQLSAHIVLLHIPECSCPKQPNRAEGHTPRLLGSGGVPRDIQLFRDVITMGNRLARPSRTGHSVIEIQTTFGNIRLDIPVKLFSCRTCAADIHPGAIFVRTLGRGVCSVSVRSVTGAHVRKPNSGGPTFAVCCQSRRRPHPAFSEEELICSRELWAGWL